MRAPGHTLFVRAPFSLVQIAASTRRARFETRRVAMDEMVEWLPFYNHRGSIDVRHLWPSA
jgi:hypothetical protein